MLVDLGAFALMQVAEDADVVDNQAVQLILEDAIGAGDGLHEGMVGHGLVEVERGEAGHVKAGDPHGADKDDTQGVRTDSE